MVQLKYHIGGKLMSTCSYGSGGALSFNRVEQALRRLLLLGVRKSSNWGRSKTGNEVTSCGCKKILRKVINWPERGDEVASSITSMSCTSPLICF